MKVRQLENKNQFLMEDNKKMIFQSYDSTIAIYDKKKEDITLGKHWDYSRTTLKHLYVFIDEKIPYTKNLQELFDTKNENNRKKAIKKLINNKKINYKKGLI